MATLLLVGAVALTGLLAGCGRKDDPLPPLRYVPTPARDLSLHQQGDVLILDVAYPQATIAGAALPGLDAVQVWWLRLPGATGPLEMDPRMFEGRAELLFVLSGPELTSSVAGNRIETSFPLPSGVEEGNHILFGVRTVSSTGEPSPLSNLVELPFAPAPSAPVDLTLTPRSDGIRVEWTPPTQDGIDGTNVYRRLATERRYGEPMQRVAEDETSFVDTSVRFGERYIYTVRAIGGIDPLVESEASVETEIDYRDTFAPAPPASLLALGETGGARLVLESSPSPDVAGYVVYRRDPEAEFRRVNDEPFSDLEFVDTGLTPGLTYSYYATAVDRAGNEGEPSDAVPVTVPDQ